MMYNNTKNKNKFIYIVVSCLIFLASFITINPSIINRYYGQTLCANAQTGLPIANNFDYKSSTFTSINDGYISDVVISSSGNYQYINFVCKDFTDSYLIFDSRINNIATSIYWCSYDGTNVTSTRIGAMNGWYNGYTYTFRIRITGTLNFSIFNSNLGLFYLAQDDLDLHYYIISRSTYSSHTAYLEGLASGGYDTGFNAGRTDGINEVLNNPNEYGLYTQAQFENSYNNGYNRGYNDGITNSNSYQDGLLAGRNDVIDNPNEYGLYSQEQYEEEYERGYLAGKSFATSLYQGYGNFTYSRFYWTEMSDIYTQLTYNDSNYILSGNFTDYEEFFTQLDGGFQISQTYVNMIIDLDGRADDNEGLDLDYSILWFEFFNPISISEFPTIVIPDSVRLGSVYYVQLSSGEVLEYNGADTIFNGIDLSSYTGYISRVGIGTINIQDYFTVGDGLAFNTRDSATYQLGFDDGYYKGSDSGYKSGYSTGYNVGKSDGINSADTNNFYSLISAVVDAPLNMFRSMFNFELLGVNMVSFFTSILTLCLVIWVIKLCLGGK